MKLALKCFKQENEMYFSMKLSSFTIIFFLIAKCLSINLRIIFIISFPLLNHIFLFITCFILITSSFEFSCCILASVYIYFFAFFLFSLTSKFFWVASKEKVVVFRMSILSLSHGNGCSIF